MRSSRALGMFWWDFLVGDTPEIFVAVLVIIGASRCSARAATSTPRPRRCLPVLAVFAFGASVWRAQRSMRK